MPQYIKTTGGYFYKTYKNGKSVRVSKDEYDRNNKIVGGGFGTWLGLGKKKQSYQEKIEENRRKKNKNFIKESYEEKSQPNTVWQNNPMLENESRQEDTNWSSPIIQPKISNNNNSTFVKPPLARQKEFYGNLPSGNQRLVRQNGSKSLNISSN